jgi:hypothetical protein
MEIDFDDTLTDKLTYSCPRQKAITCYLYLDQENGEVSNYTWMSNGLSEKDAVAASDELIAALDKKDKPYPKFSFEVLRFTDFDKFDGTRDELISQLAKTQETNLDRNLEKLFNHFGISAGKSWSWQTLAIVLAQKHIPEFAALEFKDTLPQGGAKVKWMRIHRIMLYAYVQFRKSEKPDASLESILRAMPDGLRKNLHGASNGTLRVRYYEAEKDQKVLKYCQSNKESFGMDWIKRWLDDETLEIDPVAGAIGGTPKLREKRA